MNRELARSVADAVLYEGYMLYPYRRSALKNQQRWSFGILYPPDYPEVQSGTERAAMHSEFLMETEAQPTIDLELRCLQLVRQDMTSVDDDAKVAPPMHHETAVAASSELGCERTLEAELGLKQAEEIRFSFSGACEVTGTISVEAEPVREGWKKICLDVRNTTRLPASAADRNSALLSSMLSTHLILCAKNSQFVSLLEPPPDMHAEAAACKNVGNFPVLIGEEGKRDMLLCSPIILYDYPQIAPESAVNFYDATEMDEMLTLRVMSLSNEEKDEIKRGGCRIRGLLEYTEQNAREQLMRTHGVIRSLRSVVDKE